MTLKVVHTKDGRTLYKDLDTGHWVPKDKAVAHLKQKERDDHNRAVKQDEDLKAQQIRRQQELAKKMNDQSSEMNFQKSYTNANGETVYSDSKSGWTILSRPMISITEKQSLHGTIYSFIRDEKGNKIESYAFTGPKSKYENEILPQITRDAAEFYRKRNLPTSERYKDILGPKKEFKSADEKLQHLAKLQRTNAINPNYKRGQKGDEYTKWHKNCALCTVATALQAQGYDVEAGPRDKTWRGTSTVFNINYQNKDNYILGDSGHYTNNAPKVNTRRNGSKYIFDPNGSNIIEDPPVMPKGAKAAAGAITEKVLGWGNGAVGELSVSWKNRSSWHSVAIYNDNGIVIIYDGQDNSKEVDLEKFLKGTWAQRTCLQRLDNAPLRDNVEKALGKMVKPIDRSSTI